MHAKLVTGTITGSIAKFQAVGEFDTEITVDRCEWGTYYNDGSSTTTNAVDTDFKIPAGSYIEGPICKLKLTSGTILAYVND